MPCAVVVLQVIFKRYDSDSSGTIKSNEMRNAVEDAGQTDSKGSFSLSVKLYES